MKITIPGTPLAMMRPRAVIRGRHAGVYDPQSKIKAKQRSLMAKLVALEDCDSNHLEDLYSLPLHVLIRFLVPVPFSDAIPSRNEKLHGAILPDKKPDLDNKIKYILDIGNEIIWRDDAQIVSLEAKQFYSETPCTILDVRPIKICMNSEAKKVTKIFSPKELELLQMHLCVLRDAIAQIERSDIDDKIFLIENASIELVKFANEYSFKLKKLVAR